MTSRRIDNHPVLDKLPDRKEVTFTFDGTKYVGYEGDTIASALLASGVRTLRYHEHSGTPRGIYCNIGHCYECRVTVNDVSNVRACLTPITENMVIDSEKQQPDPLAPGQDVPIPRTYEEFKEWQEKRGNNNE